MNKFSRFMCSLIAPIDLIEKNDEHNRLVDEYYNLLKKKYNFIGHKKYTYDI